MGRGLLGRGLLGRGLLGRGLLGRGLLGRHGLGLAVAAALLPAVTAGAQAAGTLTVALRQDPGSWDPIDTYLVTWGAVGSQIFDGLVLRGPDLKLVPGLATSWEFLDDNARIRFHLREGVTFQDGEPFDAAAVKFTFDRLLGAEGAKGPQQSNYNAIDHVAVVDDHTVDFFMKRPDPVILTKLAGYGAMIVPPKYVAEKGDDVFDSAPIGTGPFKVVSYEPKVSLTLEANPHYWGGAPRIDKLVYRFIPQSSTQVAELQAGRIDIAPRVEVASVPVIEQDPKLEIESIPGPMVYAMRFNTKSGPTANEAVRKAIIMAVDRDTIVKTVLSGQARPIVSFQGPLSFGFPPELKPLPFDPAGAKALLAQAGVRPGTALQLDFSGENATMREVLQAVAGYLQIAGFRVTLKPYETNVFLNDIVPNGKTGALFQESWGGWTFDYDNTAYLMYHTGEHWNPYDSVPELDAMLEAQRKTYDQAEREKTLQQVAGYVADKALDLPLYNLNAIYAVNRRVKNADLPPDERMRFVDATVE
jgi:peptide/nickel transport system substrate-binding protein